MMTHILLLLWIVITTCLVSASRNIKTVIYLCLFSLLTSLLFLMVGSPDLAMTEAIIGAFFTIFFIVCFEKYDELRVDKREPGQGTFINRKLKLILKHAPKLIFTALLFGLFLYFVPDVEANPYLKNQYLARFMDDIGGRNAVTAIYLGYRVYDTLFEVLALVISVMAVIHMSHFEDLSVKEGKKSDLERSVVVSTIMRFLGVVLLVFGIYQGGFQGGLFIAAFFVCKYLAYIIYDLPIARILRMEVVVFVATVVLAAVPVVLTATDVLTVYNSPIVLNTHLTIMGLMLGLKVGCAFIILFYRYIAIERR